MRSAGTEAKLYESRGETVQCGVCERRCEIGAGDVGWCRTRRNEDGRLFTLSYGALSSIAADPIEKKPLYHFHPGTMVLTCGGWSCNFGCLWCQNWEISKSAPPPEAADTRSPKDFIATAQECECAGVAVSYNEPTLSLEWSLDMLPLARAAGLYTAFVSNAYMTAEALRLLASAGLQAMNADIKGPPEAVRQWCGDIDVEKVWRNCAEALRLGLHVEITTLVIPGVNESDEALRSLAQRIVRELGRSVCWHVTAYHPDFRFKAPATRPETLEKAWEIGRAEGLWFVFTGNVLTRHGQDTNCPQCGICLIRRRGFRAQVLSLAAGRCTGCRAEIPGVW